MRLWGRPSASTGASDIAVGSRGSLRAACSNQAANRRKGSSASIKSPLVNPLGCCIGSDSDIPRETRMMALPPSSLVRQGRYRGRRGAIHVAARWIATGPWLLVLALTGGGCSLAYRLGTPVGESEGADQEGCPPSVAP